MEDSLKLALLLYVLANASIVLSIPILRQISGFIFLAFIPGYLFLRMLNLNGRDFTETIVYSAALSMALLMFIGLFVNEILHILGLPMPLSTLPLMIALNGLTLILFLFSYTKKSKAAMFLPSLKAHVPAILRLSFLLLLPILSVVGALYHNIFLLILMILSTAILCMVSVVSDRIMPHRYFPLVIASVSIALLFHTVFISKYFIGSDIFTEFYVFKLTEINGFWHASGPVFSYSLIDSLNSILSITILPTIYTAVLSINGETFFKLFYPFVFSLIPLSLYKLYEQQTGKSVAILSVFFFISAPTVFYGLEPLSLSRQILGQFFFILSMILITERRFPINQKRFLIIVFAAALVVSHYSMAYVFIFYILLLFILSRIRILRYEKVSAQILTPTLILLLIAMTFSWYIYVSDSPLNQLTNAVQRIVTWFGTDLFRAEARVQPALSSLSPTTATSLIGTVHKSLIYVEHAFIGIGILILVARPKKFNLYPEFRLMSIVSFVLFLLVLGVPNLAPTLNMTRFYSIVIPFLAPFSVLGGKFLIELIGRFAVSHKQKLTNIPVDNVALHIITCVLIAAFLFNVGLVNHITAGYPYSYSLDLDRREKSNDLEITATTHSLYFVDQDVFSAKWLAKNANSTSRVYADWNSRNTVLKSYVLLSDERILQITNGTTLDPETLVYMKYLNVRIGVISTASLELLNTSDVSSSLSDCSRIYSNRDCEIYSVP